VITSKSFDIAECQVVLFTSGLQFSASRVLIDMSQSVKLYDAEPVMLPNADEMPPEVPRIILSSRDGRHRMQASAIRCDIFRQALPEEPGPRLSELLPACLPIIRAYKRATNAAFDRLAIVVKRIVPFEQPAKLLSEHFCKDEWLQGPLNRPQQFELHAHKVFEVPGSVYVNSWFRCKTAILNLPEQRPGILIEQDFNTLKDIGREYTQEDVETFFDAVVPAFDKVLDMYFPESAEHGAVGTDKDTHV
jgi:hypothetical protein